jgi:hypothetical protein
MITTRWQSIGYLIACCVAATPAAAQSVTLSGQVIEVGSGQPIATALVEVKPERERVLTDAQGRFHVNTTLGEHVVVVSALGYDAVLTPMTFTGPQGQVEVALKKDPIRLEAVVASASQLDTRRRGVPFSVRTLDVAQIATSNAPDLSRLVEDRLGVRFVACSQSNPRMRRMMEFFKDCVRLRGGTAPATVFVDEVQMASVQALTTYAPQDVALVEVYRNGVQIRVYTRKFMERPATMAFRPIFLQ